MSRTAGKKRDASLPRFLAVEARASGRFEGWLEPFLALGCGLEQSRSGAGLTLDPPPDLVLYDLACGLEGLSELHARFPAASVMVVGPRSQRALAERALAAGAHEWLCAVEQLDDESAYDAIERLLLLGPRAALPRSRRAKAASTTAGSLLASPTVAPLEPREPPVPAPPIPEQVACAQPTRAPIWPAPEPVAAEAAAPPPRAAARAGSVTRVFEVAPDGGPAQRPAPRIEHQGLADTHLELVLACAEPLSAELLLVGVELAGALRWAGFEVEHSTDLGQGRHAVRCRQARGARDFFAPQALLPTFDARAMRYLKPGLGPRARAWVELGVLREVELDRVLVCPRCQALPTFRLGCRRCGSGEIDGARLIHHFPCAHVGPVRDYQLDGALVCPKCAARPLIVNSDFEYLDGPLACAQCGACDGQGELVGHCFACAQRFLSRVAATLVLKGFDVDRLVPLDRVVPTA